MTAIKDQLQTDLGDAMRTATRSRSRRSASRWLRSRRPRSRVIPSVTLTDEQVVELLRGEGKRRAEAAELYDQGDRDELAARERAQAAVLERYLPKEMDDDALAAIVAEEVAAVARPRRHRRPGDGRGDQGRPRPGRW